MSEVRRTEISSGRRSTRATRAQTTGADVNEWNAHTSVQNAKPDIEEQNTLAWHFISPNRMSSHPTLNVLFVCERHSHVARGPRT